MNMFSAHRKIFSVLSARHLLVRSSILSGYSPGTSSLSTHGEVKRHRTSSSSSSSHSAHSHRINTHRNQNQTHTLRRLFQPVEVKPMMGLGKFDGQTSNDDSANIGQELTGGKTLERSKCLFLMEKTYSFFFVSDALLRIITDFYRREEVKKLSADQGLDIRLFQDAYVSFRKFCLQSTVLPVDLHIVFSDIISESGNIHALTLFSFLMSRPPPRSRDGSLSLLSSTRPRNVSSSDLYGGSEEDQRPPRSSQLVTSATRMFALESCPISI